ncbi:hypothetical protein FACS1894172_01050 [Spirochaetia bacterium]|nr:hypothetical protein FACS1894164_06730 [Spirochaetia bacterium]GHU29599.1 hypothetical protein FACS1894172_01050 [Spirochaetia bacterium]
MAGEKPHKGRSPTGVFLRHIFAAAGNLFETYYNEQMNGIRNVIVAEMEEDTAGYITLIKSAEEGPFCGKNIPEILVSWSNNGENQIDILLDTII